MEAAQHSGAARQWDPDIVGLVARPGRWLVGL